MGAWDKENHLQGQKAWETSFGLTFEEWQVSCRPNYLWVYPKW